MKSNLLFQRVLIIPIIIFIAEVLGFIVQSCCKPQNVTYRRHPESLIINMAELIQTPSKYRSVKDSATIHYDSLSWSFSFNRISLSCRSTKKTFSFFNEALATKCSDKATFLLDEDLKSLHFISTNAWNNVIKAGDTLDSFIRIRNWSPLEFVKIFNEHNGWFGDVFSISVLPDPGEWRQIKVIATFETYVEEGFSPVFKVFP